jgi:hypothetical protein
VSLRLARWLLRRRKRRLERRLDGPFDPVVSAELDRIVAALEALG